MRGTKRYISVAIRPNHYFSTEVAMNSRLQLASADDLQQVLPLVEAYHQLEGIQMGLTRRSEAVYSLLCDSSLGGIWLIFTPTALAGYIALTFGYSIEFGGKDAFVDEFYIKPEFRGQGIGKQTLNHIQQEARVLGIQAMHLEVAQQNIRAQKLYVQANFQPRSKYRLMSVNLNCIG